MNKINILERLKETETNITFYAIMIVNHINKETGEVIRNRKVKVKVFLNKMCQEVTVSDINSNERDVFIIIKNGEFQYLPMDRIHFYTDE